MTNTLKALRVPAAMLALASVVLLPASFASAAHTGQDAPNAYAPNTVAPNTVSPNEEPQRRHAPMIAFSIVSIVDNGDGTGTIWGALRNVPEQITEDTGIQDGASVQVRYTAETKFIENREEVTIEAFAVGDTAFALGQIDLEDMVIDARAVLDKTMKPRMHIGEVVEVDTQANTIVVKSLRKSENGETNYLLVTYDEETTFVEDQESADESAISVGDKIHVRGTVDWDSEEYLAEIDADKVVLFDETLPPGPGHQHRPGYTWPLSENSVE